MKRHRVLVTDDELEALEAIRPYAAQIAAARRRGFVHCLGLATFFSHHRFDVFWNPNFWFWFSEAVQDAHTDPARMVAAQHANDDDEQQRRERKSFAASAEEGRAELDRLFAALRGQHTAGRPKGTRKVDGEKTRAELDRLARKFEDMQDEKWGSVRRAAERLASIENVTPAAIRKRVTRRTKRPR